MYWRASIYQLGLTFFGLTPDYKKIVLDEILLLCYHSQGGFTHDEVYNMPIRYRRYYLQKLGEMLEKQQEEMNKKFNPTNSQKSDAPKPRDPLPIPDFAFTAKAPKK